MSEVLKVLIVEDDVDLRTALESDVMELGFEVVSAGNGLEALVVFRTTKIDIILSDLNMPKMSGVTLLAELRQLGYYHPFIVLSGYGTREEVIELIRGSAYNFLNKPVLFEDLKVALVAASKYARLLSTAMGEARAKVDAAE
ncbi:MAG: response regulator [Chitinophagaceae bacterium]|nr:response regulator [Oligoflexus sp.]